jgi:uncharacterized membrane protein
MLDAREPSLAIVEPCRHNLRSTRITTKGYCFMAILALGLVIFLGLHSIRIVADDGRAKAIARLGEGPWKGIYSVLSVIGFVLIIWGFAQARYGAPLLWAPPVWTRHIAILLMLFSMILLSGYAFKRSHIAVAVHHPMVWGVAIWAAAHLLANGSAADVLLFGAFFLWAVANLFSAYARDRRNAVVYPTPNWSATIGAIVLGVVLWGLFIGGLHLWLFRVSPLAM